MGHLVPIDPGPSKFKIRQLSQQSSSDADIAARVLEKFGFLSAFVCAAWLNFIDRIYGYLAGDGSLPALIVSVSAGLTLRKAARYVSRTIH